jgi:hypothetical protein
MGLDTAACDLLVRGTYTSDERAHILTTVRGWHPYDRMFLLHKDTTVDELAALEDTLGDDSLEHIARSTHSSLIQAHLAERDDDTLNAMLVVNTHGAGQVIASVLDHHRDLIETWTDRLDNVRNATDVFAHVTDTFARQVVELDGYVKLSGRENIIGVLTERLGLDNLDTCTTRPELLDLVEQLAERQPVTRPEGAWGDIEDAVRQLCGTNAQRALAQISDLFDKMGQPRVGRGLNDHDLAVAIQASSGRACARLGVTVLERVSDEDDSDLAEAAVACFQHRDTPDETIDQLLDTCNPTIAAALCAAETDPQRAAVFLRRLETPDISALEVDWVELARTLRAVDTSRARQRLCELRARQRLCELALDSNSDSAVLGELPVELLGHQLGRPRTVNLLCDLLGNDPDL